MTDARTLARTAREALRPYIEQEIDALVAAGRSPGLGWDKARTAARNRRECVERLQRCLPPGPAAALAQETEAHIQRTVEATLAAMAPPLRQVVAT